MLLKYESQETGNFPTISYLYKPKARLTLRLTNWEKKVTQKNYTQK